MNKLGFSFTELGRIPIGFFYDMYVTYKKQYNFETKRGLYQVEEIGSLDDI
jgi:hypothetical protein